MTMYNDNFAHTHPFSDTTSRMNLATGVAQTYTVPGTNDQKYRAEFRTASTSNVYIGYNSAPTAPVSGAQVNNGNVEYLPMSARYVKGGDVLSFISGDATGAQVGVSLLQLPS